MAALHSSRIRDDDLQSHDSRNVCVCFFFFLAFLGEDKQGLPNTVTWAVSLSLSPTMLVPTQMYMPASLFLVLEIISFPPRIWGGGREAMNLSALIRLF